MSIDQEPLRNNYQGEELESWLGDWFDQTDHRTSTVDTEILDTAEIGEETASSDNGLSEALRGINSLAETQSAIGSFALNTREQIDINKEMSQQFWQLVEALIQVAHGIDALVAKERPLLTASDAANAMLKNQLSEYRLDYQLLEQYRSDLENLYSQLSIINNRINLNQEIIQSRENTPGINRNPNKHLEDPHVTAAIEKQSLLLAEKAELESEIAKLQNQIQEVSAIIASNTESQASHSRQAQELRDKIINQAESMLAEAVLKVGETINNNPAVNKAMMQAALAQSLEQDSVKSIEG
jgi:hypothetical protein